MLSRAHPIIHIAQSIKGTTHSTTGHVVVHSSHCPVLFIHLSSPQRNSLPLLIPSFHSIPHPTQEHTTERTKGQPREITKTQHRARGMDGRLIFHPLHRIFAGSGLLPYIYRRFASQLKKKNKRLPRYV